MPATLRIRRARPDEANALTALAKRAKAHWGYDAKFMDRVSDAMTLSPADIAAHEVFVLQDPSGAILGFHRVIPSDPAELEDMWVEPSAMGNGHGRRLFQHGTAVARSLGAAALELDADPNAVGFYERMGMERIGETPSTLIPGRSLPRMRLQLG
jgi:GNAT superfamily N-acetyltransferase